MTTAHILSYYVPVYPKLVKDRRGQSSDGEQYTL